MDNTTLCTQICHRVGSYTQEWNKFSGKSFAPRNFFEKQKSPSVTTFKPQRGEINIAKGQPPWKS
ncbi:MAG: hypothetical protein DRR08_23915 [Candidatus Parabeggiatoa sp. nov. 2]|nr:MAG: hypothetical protein B6247_13980 [Beggiatoa sp. 4572_84]RKZ55589.1 MAG: hypothetical protein DRR08_23915 [Gammaproteobacteria bacterium]